MCTPKEIEIIHIDGTLDIYEIFKNNSATGPTWYHCATHLYILDHKDNNIHYVSEYGVLDWIKWKFMI